MNTDSGSSAEATIEEIAVTPSTRVDEVPAGYRPSATLPIGHLVRISLYWLGLTAIDGAVGVFN